MDQTAQSVENALLAAEHPAILCSWGRDSSLLLHYVLALKPDITIYYFGDKLPKLAEQLIIERDLTVCSFAPMRRYVSNKTFVEEYAFNGHAVPMLSEIVVSESCPHDLSKPCTPNFFFPHDVVLWGYRKIDRHPSLPDLQFECEIQIEHTKFVAPLYDLSNEDVLSELGRLRLSYIKDVPVEICNDCLHALASPVSRARLPC